MQYTDDLNTREGNADLVNTTIGGKRMKMDFQVRGRLVTAVAAMLCITLAPDAKPCGSPNNNTRFSNLKGLAPMMESLDRMLPAQSEIPGSQSDTERNADGSGTEIVGMWITNFYVGTTTERYDHTIEQFHADGTEVMSSALFGPSEGNVCFGVWNVSGPKTFKLNHVGWTFDQNGHFGGTASITATIAVSPQGDTFVGTFVAESFDSKGKILPEFTVKGMVRGERFTANSVSNQFL